METKKKGLTVFLLISFGLAWGAILGARLLGLSLENPLVQLPIAFSPAIAALVVRCWVTREGFRDAGLALHLRRARTYYLLAWIGPVLVFAATAGLAAALGLYRPDVASLRQLLGETGVPVPVALLLLALPILTMPIYWGEEFGWRSYLQPRVSRRPVHAALITGLIWAVWHYPLAFTDYVEYSNPFFGIVAWTLPTIALAVIFAWLFLRTGSIWVPCLAHAGSNLITGTLTGALLVDGANLDPSTVDLIAVVPLVAICFAIFLSGQLSPAEGLDRRTHAA